MNDKPAPTALPSPPGQQFVITRQGLLDGSMLARARAAAPPGTRYLSDAEIEASLDAMLTGLAPGEDAWLFGYGSLMWNPAIDFAEQRVATIHGLHRSYCLWLHSGRGSPEHPGLMLALDRGGSCRGLAFRIPAREARTELLLAWRREMFGGAYEARWVPARTDDGDRARDRLRGEPPASALCGTAGGDRDRRAHRDRRGLARLLHRLSRRNARRAARPRSPRSWARAHQAARHGAGLKHDRFPSGHRPALVNCSSERFTFQADSA